MTCYIFTEFAHTWSQQDPAHCRRQAGPLTLPPVPDSETTLNPRSYYESVPWDRSQARGLGYSHAIFISLQRCCSLQISMKDFSTFQNYLQSLFLVGHESAVFSLGLCFLLLAWKFKVLVAQSRLTLCNPTDCSPPGSSVHGDSPGKNTRVGCHSLLQGLFPTQGFNPGLLDCRQILYCPSHWGRLTSAVRFPSNTTDSYQPTEAGLQDSSSPQSSDFWENCRHAAGREAGQGGWLSGPWGYAYLMRMMTEGVWAMAPIMLQTHITHRKVRKASWHPGLGHFPGITVAFSGGMVMRHAQPVRFWKGSSQPC